MADKKLDNLLLNDIFTINNILFDTPEAGDIEHYISCHPDQLPEIVQRFSSKIEKVQDLCSTRLFQYWDAKAKCGKSVPELIASLPQDDLPEDHNYPEMSDEERAAFIKEINGG